MEYLIYVALVFAISCIVMFITVSICDDRPEKFVDWVMLVLILGTFCAALVLLITNMSSEIQKEYLAQPVDVDEGRTPTEFLIYTAIVFAWFAGLCLIGVVVAGSISFSVLGKILLTCVIGTVTSIGVTTAASSIQYSFAEQPEPPAIERINFDEGQSYE